MWRGKGDMGEEGRGNMIWVYTVHCNVQYKGRVHPRMQRAPKAWDKNGIITAASSSFMRALIVQYVLVYSRKLQEDDS
jgi:hypothetical protein